MIVYKVAGRRPDGQWESYGVLARPWKRLYRIGEVTRPMGGSKLFAFRRLKDARWLHGDNEWLIILRCETEGAKPLRHAAWAISDIADFWRDTSVLSTETPDGTLGCPWLKVLEVVE